MKKQYPLFNNSIYLIFIFILLTISCEVVDEDPKSINVTTYDSTTEVLICDTENKTADGNSFCSTRRFESNNFGTCGNQSSEYARSGKTSVKLSKESQFGLTYNIQNVKVGEVFELGVWRLKGCNKACLVASDTAAKKFYKTQNEAIRTQNDWEYLLLKIEIPKEMNGEKLVVYVYNPDIENVAYFDDMEIKFRKK